MLRCGAGIDAEGVDILPIADEGEQTDVEQTWPGLFWLPPADDRPNERKLLHLDDELAGLIEAADTPGDGAGTHSTKPEPIMSVPGGAFATASLLLLCPSFWQMRHTLTGILLHGIVALCCVVPFSVVLQYCMLCLSITARAYQGFVHSLHWLHLQGPSACYPLHLSQWSIEHCNSSHTVLSCCHVSTDLVCVYHSARAVQLIT